MAETGIAARAPALSAPKRALPAAASFRTEIVGLIALLLATFAAFAYRLSSVLIPGHDEGVYLYASKLVAAGLVPYRDFLLAHPPLIAYLGGAWMRIAGDGVMAARLAYGALILASAVPLYALARHLLGSRQGALLSVAAYTTGMVLLANMGRTVRLEPLMDAFLIAAFCAHFLRPNGLRWRAAIGVFFALAVLTKLVAAVPVALLVISDLLWTRRERPFLRRVTDWSVAAAAAGLVLAAASASLLSEPRFLEDVVRLQAERPGLPLALRLFYLLEDSARFPVVALALAAGAWLIVRGRDSGLRILSFVAIGSTVVLVVAFPTFFGSYLIEALPWFAIIFSWVVLRTLARVRHAQKDRLLLAGTLLLAVGVPLAYDEAYFQTGHVHFSSAAPIIAELRTSSGYLYSMYPSFALESNRPLYPWYYTADSYLARIDGRIGDDDFAVVFASCQSLVLWPDELADYPRARAYVEGHFRLVVSNADYALWERSSVQ